MIKIDKFLGCLELETGGLILGWLSFVLDIISLIFMAAGIIGLSVFDCKDLEEMLNEYHDHHGGSHQGDDFHKMCSTVRVIVLVSLVIGFLIGLGFTFMSYLLIKGTNARDHVRVKPMMVLFAIMTVLSLLSVLSFTAQGIVTGLLYGCIYGYFFVALYSLYDKFREEHERGYNPQYAAQPVMYQQPAMYQQPVMYQQPQGKV